MSTTDQEREALLPCPFCGGKAVRSTMMDESLWSHERVPYRKVRCPDCEIGTEYLCEGYEPTADEAWNTRATTPPSPQSTEAELRARIAELEAEAARYRLLRRGQRWSVINGMGECLRAEELDAAIDSALASLRREIGGGA